MKITDEISENNFKTEVINLIQKLVKNKPRKEIRLLVSPLFEKYSEIIAYNEDHIKSNEQRYYNDCMIKEAFKEGSFSFQNKSRGVTTIQIKNISHTVTKDVFDKSTNNERKACIDVHMTNGEVIQLSEDYLWVAEL